MCMCLLPLGPACAGREGVPSQMFMGYYVCNREGGMCVTFSQFLVHTAGLLVKPVSLQCSHLSKFDFELSAGVCLLQFSLLEISSSPMKQNGNEAWL